MAKTTVMIAVGRPKTCQQWAEVFQQLQPDWHIVCWDEVGDTVKADFAVVWRPSKQLFLDQPQLKAIFNIGAGVDAIDFSFIPAELPVYRIEDGGMAAQMAEYAVYGALLATQRFASYGVQQQKQQWQQAAPIYRHQWPVGVLGFGQIGEKVAQVMQHLDYPVSTWVRTPRSAPGNIQVFAGAEQFSDFLAQSRILINVLPLTPETKGIINAQHLSQLPVDSFFINMARGAHVVDDDLVAALDSGHLMGALLDVFHTEPLPPEHVFWTHPKVHMTPHIAGVSLREPTAEQIQAKIKAFLQNQTVSGLVERNRMY